MEQLAGGELNRRVVVSAIGLERQIEASDSHEVRTSHLSLAAKYSLGSFLVTVFPCNPVGEFKIFAKLYKRCTPVLTSPSVMVVHQISVSLHYHRALL